MHSARPAICQQMSGAMAARGGAMRRNEPIGVVLDDWDLETACERADGGASALGIVIVIGFCKVGFR